MNLLGAVDNGIYGYYTWKKLVRSPALPIYNKRAYFYIGIIEAVVKKE